LISSVTADQLGLPTREVEGEEYPVVAWPQFVDGASIPPVYEEEPGASAVKPLTVYPIAEYPAPLGDGFLGQDWFARRVWTFDYRDQQLTLGASVPQSGREAHRVPIYFNSDSTGQHLAHYPRIEARVEGTTYSFLLDTGATLVLTDSAHEALADGIPRVRGTSYITASTFEDWRESHPDWRVIEEAEAKGGEPIIEVPEVTIAGHTVGPVWFTRRPTENYHEYMSQYMDEQVEGALGGSLFKYFRMTVDYPDEVAIFELPE
jgi:hypothetical protein